MSGLLRRLTRRGPATADENRSAATESSDPAAAPAETPAEPGGHSSASMWAGRPRHSEESSGSAAQSSPAGEPSVAASGEPSAAATGEPSAAATGEQPTVALPAAADQPLPAWTIAATQPTAFAAQPAPPRDLPAGVDPGELAAAPAASARRGKLRRRLRYLRHVRELLLRDLGGFTYEVHRTGAGKAQDAQRRLAAAKAERISKLDEEVLALESRLGEPHVAVVLREPGIGGTCPECGELHASDARFCSRCGVPLDAKARAERAPATAETPSVAEPQPASVLWAGGPRPAPERAPEEQEAPPPPSELTTQWLATDQPTTFARGAQPDEPATTTTDEPATTTDEPAVTTDGPAKLDEPAATTDEPAEPALDEPATAVDVPPDETAGEAPAKPKRVAKPRKRAPVKRQPKKQPEPSANGRRDEDVPPPAGDPLASPREQGS